MRALYYLLAAAVLFYAVCEVSDLAQRKAVEGGSGPRRAAPAAVAEPAIKPSEWRSAPASGAVAQVGKGKGVLVDKATGKRYRTP